MSETEPQTETLRNFREVLHVAYDKILIKRSEPVLMTEGGLHIAESHAEKPDEGYVIKTGDGRLLRDGSTRPLLVRPGDRVLFGKHSGSATEVQTPSGPLVVLREDEILAWWTVEEIPQAEPVVAPTEG